MRIALGSDHGGFELKQDIWRKRRLSIRITAATAQNPQTIRSMQRKLHMGFWTESVSLESLYAEQVLVFLSLQTKLREFVQQYVQTALLLKQPDFTMTQTSLRLEDV